MWLWSGPVCQLVLTIVESSLKMLVNAVSRATWRRYDTAFSGTLQEKTGAAVTPSARLGGEIRSGAAGGESVVNREAADQPLVPAAFEELTLQ